MPYPRLQDEMFALLLGEVAIAPFEDSAWKVAEKAGVADRLKVVGEPYTVTKRAMALRRDLRGLRDRLDAAVADLLRSPEYASLYAAWHVEPPSFWAATREIWMAGATVLLGMLLWQSLPQRAESRESAEFREKRASTRFPSRLISRLCGLAAVALGGAVLIGWALDLATLKSVLPGLVAMQP